MIPFEKYSKIKNKYCLSYFGSNPEYIIQLKLLRPQINKHYPELEIYISCPDHLLYLLDKEPNLMPASTINEKYMVAYNRIITCNMVNHPIEELLEESGIKTEPCDQPTINLESKLCVIAPNGIAPTSSLNKEEVEKIKTKYQNMGYFVEINTNIKEANIVVGVENELLFLAASMGIRTELVPTGLGTELYKKIFIKTGKILNLV